MKTSKIILFIVFYYLLSYIKVFVLSDIPRIVFLNVGQGDSSILILNSETSILIDGGPDLSLENSILGKYTYPWCNIKKIYISHFHADHTKGLPNLVSRCTRPFSTFNDISVSSYDRHRISDLLSKNLYAKPSKRILETILLGSVEKFKISENKSAAIYTIWPQKNYSNLSDENDRSLIQLVDIGTYEILFTGDASGHVVEQALTPNILELIDGRLDVYKVPHHGSSTGRSLKVLELLHPVDCVISVGRNSFGHPNSQVLSDLGNFGCNVHRTDLEGDIEFKL